MGGGAHASTVTGFGAPLLIDFVTWSAMPTPIVTPATVLGGAGSANQDAAPGVAGALRLVCDHLS